MSLSNAIELVAARAVSARATAENVPSPCVSVCRMDAQRHFCEGCLRSLDEIRRWSSASDADKRTIWAAIEDRIAVRRQTCASDHAMTPIATP